MDREDNEIDDVFNNIRNDLNLDDETAEDALNTYRRISANYSLEVILGCILFLLLLY